MMRTEWLAIALAVVGCHHEGGPAAAPKSASSIAESSQLAAATMRAHMAAHLEAAADLQAAIADGRLTDARDRAAWFASHPMDAKAALRPYIDQMRDAAVRIERAGDVAAAGLQLGRLGGTCAACHVAARARPAFAYEPPPLQDDTLESQMALHEWAGARLWQGLIGPADELWLEGARAMAAARFDVAKSAHAKPNARVIELGELLHEQAREAARTTDREARAQLYGRMMDTCASCHAIVRPAPVARGDDHQR